MKTLADLKPCQFGKVIRLGSTGEFRRRIIDMGIVPGTVILMKKVALMGDPIEISLRGYSLSIRKSDARKIVVEIIEGIDNAYCKKRKY